METLETLRDAYKTELAYQMRMLQDGKQNVASVSAAFFVMAQIANRALKMQEKEVAKND